MTQTPFLSSAREHDAHQKPGRARRSLVATATLALAFGTFAATSPATAAEPESDAPATVVYVEVNNNDFANVGDYTIEGTNDPVFDVGIIFAANINFDGTAAYLHLNERVTWTLENADTQIRPVQENGTKVLLSILGNHQGAGFANFQTPEEADAFAAQIEDVVETYDLDGVDFDDEWTQYGVNGTPQPNADSFVWLLEATRDRLGDDKLITLYDIGPSAKTTDFTQADVPALLDYAWNPYYGAYDAPTQFPTLTNAALGAAAVDLTQTSSSTAADFAQRTVDDGYGAYVTYNLGSSDISEYLSNITQVFYGKNAAYQAAPVDTVAPTLATVDHPSKTKLHKKGYYQRITYALADETGLASYDINGTVVDLGGELAAETPTFRSGKNGAVSGTNTLTITDTAGNVQVVQFELK